MKLFNIATISLNRTNKNFVKNRQNYSNNHIQDH